MMLSVVTYFCIIFYPIKKIDRTNIKAFIVSINKFLVHKNKVDLIKHLEDIVYFYDSLFDYTIKDERSRVVFEQFFSSNTFLDLFSEHAFLFERTIEKYLEKLEKSSSNQMSHLKKFISILFVKSLNNQNSYLNSFLNEDIYPNSECYLDELFINRTNINYRFLFDQTGYNNLTIVGKISYMKLVKHYFSLIHEKNRSTVNTSVCEETFNYNDSLIEYFFADIQYFFENTYEQEEIQSLFRSLRNIGWHYRWGVSTSKKSENLRKNVGVFLYEVLYSMILNFKIEHEETFRIELLNLADNYLEEQDNTPDTNIAYISFIDKLKEKIIGDMYEPNFKGYYPAVIKIYFYMFDTHLFSERSSGFEETNLNLPILLRLKEAFPKLYSGFIREFYDAKKLPSDKKDKLQKDGVKIINDFLPNYVSYSFLDNSLTRHLAWNNHDSKILLNTVKEK